MVSAALAAGGHQVIRGASADRSGSEKVFLARGTVAVSTEAKRRRTTGSLLDQVLELLQFGRMPEPGERPRLDLTDPLARDVERLPHLFERLRRPVLEAVAHLDDLALAVPQLVEQLADVR